MTKESPLDGDQEVEQSVERWASLERWAEYLCVPVKYVRERTREVLETRKGMNAEGEKYRAYGEQDIAEHIPEYSFVREMELVGKTQEEIRSAVLTRVLVQAGYADQLSLRKAKIPQFLSMSFDPYGKGQAFHTAILGDEIRIQKESLLEIGKYLNLPQITEENKTKLRSILTTAGYEDRRSLELQTVAIFCAQSFGIFGKGMAFCAAILDKKFSKGSNLDRDYLLEIANVLNLPIMSEKKKSTIKEALILAGYPDRRSLEMESIDVFVKKDFPPHGKAKGIYSSATGKKIGEKSRMHRSEMLEIAESIEFPELSYDRRRDLCVKLSNSGFPDMRALEIKSVEDFKSANFDCYGNPKNMYTWITGKNLGWRKWLQREHLLEIGRVLEMPELCDERKAEMQQLLEEAGYPDQRSLEISPIGSDFQSKNFGRYGKGNSFFRWVTGKSVGREKLGKGQLVKMASILQIPVFAEERRNEMRELLQKNGYADLRILQIENPEFFMKKQYGEYGGGIRLYKWIFGKGGKMPGGLRRKHLLEIGHQLGLPELSEERKDEMIQMLMGAGYSDADSLRNANVAKFSAADFGRYGKGAGFFRWVTGEVIKENKGNLRKQHLQMIAAHLSLPSKSE